MTDRETRKDSPSNGSSRTLMIVLSVISLLCVIGVAWISELLDDDPPSIGAPYDDAEAFLVMEALAGELIAVLPDDEDSAKFAHRSWESETCRWGWDDRREWEGLVDVSISYKFPREYLDSEETGTAYAELIIAKLEDLGIEPDVKPIEQWNEKRVTAQRDDGLSVHYNSKGLYISAGCVPDDGRVVYTPPHGGIPPAGDAVNWT